MCFLYNYMEESLRGGLSLTSSGFGFWSHDIGGFESQSTPDVYKRWCAFGLLSTHSRLHGSTSYRVPWVYDEESVEVVRYFTNLKAKLMPYLYRNAIETSQTGIPMMRSMVLEHTTVRQGKQHHCNRKYWRNCSVWLWKWCWPQGVCCEGRLEGWDVCI